MWGCGGGCRLGRFRGCWGVFVGRDWEFLGVENGENRALGGD